MMEQFQAIVQKIFQTTLMPIIAWTPNYFLILTRWGKDLQFWNSLGKHGIFEQFCVFLLLVKVLQNNPEPIMFNPVGRWFVDLWRNLDEGNCSQIATSKKQRSITFTLLKGGKNFSIVNIRHTVQVVLSKRIHLLSFMFEFKFFN